MEIARQCLKLYRSLLRRSVQAADPRGPCPLVLCQSGRQGVSLVCEQAGSGLRLLLPGSQESGQVCLPGSLLAQLEGNTREPVCLQQTGPFKARASWREGEQPQVLEFDTADPASLATKGPPKASLHEVEQGFLTALGEAAKTAARQAMRTPLTYLLLRGRGEVAASDGRQLLIQSGFTLPNKEDLLVPALPAFTARELLGAASVRLGLADEQLVLEAGPWALWLKTGRTVRYPNIDAVLDQTKDARTALRLHPDDVRMALEQVPSLPGADQERAPLTLDLTSNQVILRASEEGRSAALGLAQSGREGPPVRLAVDRRYLLRALALGFTEIRMSASDRPLVCRDARRTYVWMPLEDAAVVRPPDTPDPRRPQSMPVNNGRPAEQPDNGVAPSDPPDALAEAEALRSVLNEVQSRLSRLIVLLRQQKKQQRAVQMAAESLRRLHLPGP